MKDNYNLLLNSKKLIQIKIAFGLLSENIFYMLISVLTHSYLK